MTQRRFLRWAVCLPVLFAVAATHVQAQATGPQLVAVVSSTPGATTGQKNAAVAVQAMCGALRANGYTNDGMAPADATPQTRDLYLRCNELIETANALNPNSGGSTRRSLGLPAEDIVSAVQQVSGEELGSQGALATQVPSGQFTNIGARLSALRFGAGTAVSRGQLTALDTRAPQPVLADTFHFNDTSSSFYTLDGGGAALRPASLSTMVSEAAVASGTPAAAAALPTRSPWGWFTEGSYNWGNRDQTADEDGFDYDSYSVTAGVDYNFGKSVLGGSVGYDHYKADFDKSALVGGGDSIIRGYSGSLFGAMFGEHVSLNGILSYGKLRSDLTRVVVYDDMSGGTCTLGCGANRLIKGSPDGHYAAAGATVGYDLNSGAWQFSPTASLNYRRVNIDHYSEVDESGGGLALSFDKQTIESVRSVLGASISRPVSTRSGVLTPSFKAEWHHEFKDDSRAIYMKYASDFTDTSRFFVPTDKPESNFGIVGAGLAATFSHRLQGYLYYERLVGISYLKSNAVSVGLRGQF